MVRERETKRERDGKKEKGIERKVREKDSGKE
jgi:hypothetical protein